MERKEAIEVIRSFLNPHHSDIFSEALETLIPELKESEDERIRKELIDLLNLLWRHYNFPYDKNKYEEFLAWLEKQGKQNSLKIAKFKVGDTLCRKGYTDHIVTDIYDKCEIPTYICKTDEGESHIMFTDQDKWNLKPYWKPSEEQIMAFEHFVKSIGESGYASPYDNNTKLIYSLINELKNIRHER